MTESSAKATKAYKAKVASLSSEKVELRARIQSLTEDVVKHKSDLKHTSTAKARAEDREKKAKEGLRVAKDELRVVKEELQASKEELQAAREELCTKAAVLERARREASEAESSVERLTEECNAIRGEFQRQEALVSQRDGVIVELRDEACTLWAFGWLAFQCRAAKVFRVWTSIFKFQMKKRRKNPFLMDEVDTGAYSDTPSSVPLPDELEVPVEAYSLLSHAGASPFDLHGLEARTTEAARSSTSNI